MDTHDTPSIPLTEPFAPGCVLTVEPGLYIPRDADEAPKELRGVGVRIEDDVLITTEGKPEVLSAMAPVAAEAVERLARRG